MSLFVLVASGAWGQTVDYRQEMRDFVKAISAYARVTAPDFIVIPQNGQELLTNTGEADGTLVADYVAAIDGIGREDVFYGFEEDNVATLAEDRDYLLGFLDLAEANGIEVMVSDYCWTESFVDESYAENAQRNYISFAADKRELTTIPPRPGVPFNENASNVGNLSQAKNFLYLINPEEFSSREVFLNRLQQTNFDLLLIDPFVHDQSDGAQLSQADVASLRTKENGSTRLVIAYLSIGEAEDFRYYWDSAFNQNPPDWLTEENLNFPGDFKVRYWVQEWQDIIFGNDQSFMAKIVAAGFDGVYLDIIDAFEFFEERQEGVGEDGGGAGCSSVGVVSGRGGAAGDALVAGLALAALLFSAMKDRVGGQKRLSRRSRTAAGVR